MTRRAVERLQYLSMGTAAAMAMTLAACSSDVPSKARLDAGGDGSHPDVIEVGVDHTGGAPDLPADRPDVGSDQVKDTQLDMEAADRSDVRVDGTDTFPSPSDATDLARDVVDQSIETGGDSAEAGSDTPEDIGPDLRPDEGPPDLPSDTPSSPACGDGCPSTIQPSNLFLWLSSDFGVTCDATRISDWKDRAVAGRSFKPATGKLGPACGTATLASKPVATFDRSGSTDTDSVLAIDLSPMVGSSYTVFVVERRQTAGEGYLLGTDVPNPATSTCSSNSFTAYQFGYISPTVFFAGIYGYDDGVMDCDDINATVSATLAAVVDVERFSTTDGHAFYVGSAVKGMNADPVPLMPLVGSGYLGRSFQSAVGRESRFRGDIAEVVIYKAALSDVERAAVTTYLANRWLP